MYRVAAVDVESTLAERDALAILAIAVMEALVAIALSRPHGGDRETEPTPALSSPLLL